uniref:hypothetical protein n=1 Tax=Thauera aminoaromatica TaxID=164330 RepID=UPI0035B488CB
RLAWRSAAGIHISCQKAAASGQVAYPYTGFPFEGETNLAVTGVWLLLTRTENYPDFAGPAR